MSDAREDFTSGEFRHLNIVGFSVDVMQPLALFKDDADETTFPLWLEMVDVLTITADLITSRLTGKHERKDLLDALMETMGLTVTEILIDGAAGKGYVADVRISSAQQCIRVRVGLVTALLTAIRYKLPVGISEQALSSSSYVDQREEDVLSLSDEKKMMEMLERMTPEEMGKYPM